MAKKKRRRTVAIKSTFAMSVKEAIEIVKNNDALQDQFFCGTKLHNAINTLVEVAERYEKSK